MGGENRLILIERKPHCTRAWVMYARWAASASRLLPSSNGKIPKS